MSPTQRTMAALRASGMLCEVVERWNHITRTRKDLFGFVDIVAVDPGAGRIVAVQATAAAVAARRRKIIEDCTAAARTWLLAGGAIEVWGWRKLKVKRGGKATRWAPRREAVTLADLPPAARRLRAFKGQGVGARYG